jgi:hypothetical protein
MEKAIARKKAAEALKKAANHLAKAGLFSEELNQIIRLADKFEREARQ